MDIKTLAEQYNDYIIDRRRYYHTCPELSGEEKNTRAHLKEDLEALGITDIHELETCYGLTATIHAENDILEIIGLSHDFIKNILKLVK